MNAFIAGIIFMTATEWIGISAYAGMDGTFPARRFMRQFPERVIERPALAQIYPWGEHGYSVKLTKLFTETFLDRPHLLQFHISNECSRRSGRNGGQIAPALTVLGYKRAIERKEPSVRLAVRLRVREILNLISPLLNEHTRLMFSTGLEGDFGKDAHEIVKSWMRTEISAWKKKHPGNKVRVIGIVYSANGSGGDECHGLGSKSCVVRNLDGESICFPGDSEEYECRHTPEEVISAYRKQRPTVFFAWVAAQQYGLKKHDYAPSSYEGRDYAVTDPAIAGMRSLLREIGK